MFSKQISQPCSPRLSFPEHYLQVLERNQGPIQDLLLEETEVDGPFLHLRYTWHDELTHAQADRIDTRLRAYIACAIPDACHGLLICHPGPPHGSRPSWYVENCPIPFSLVQARFSVAEKSLYPTVGPIIFAPVNYAETMARGFLRHMLRIKV